MISKFISSVCEILNIKEPTVSYDTSKFQSDTMLAQIDSAGTTMYLKAFEGNNPDQFFSVAHELRHVWQIRTDKELYFAEYKPRELCVSTEEYNLQLAELDANAFAALIMVDFFKLKPLFKGLSESVKSKIFEQMEYLKSTL